MRRRVVALEVRDEWTSDGSLGRNLKAELAKALRASAIEVDDAAPQRLAMRLRNPDHDDEGRSRDTCLELRLRASFAGGAAFAQGTACRGVEETMHHRVLNEMLRLIDTEYARVATR
jgi:hypothetical protein